MQTLTDTTALVTGGSRGIGEAIVRALHQAGASVVFNHLGDAEAAIAVQASLPRSLAIEADVSDPEQVHALFESAEQAFGPVTVVVSNAGITRDAISWKMTDEAWDAVIGVNLSGTFYVVREASRRFRARGGPGRIITMASINGERGKLGQLNYAASKGGVIALTKTLARELGRFGVTANAVAPGMVLTPMAAQLPESVLAKARDETLLGRLADPDDIAQGVLFLASPAARHITGHCLRIDGGQYL